MSDVSKTRRVFEVWLDRNIVGADPIVETIVVEAGEDAGELCADALETMIQNNLDTGWAELKGAKREAALAVLEEGDDVE